MSGRVRLEYEERFLLQKGGQVLAQGMGASPTLKVFQICGDVELRDTVSVRSGVAWGQT